MNCQNVLLEKFVVIGKKIDQDICGNKLKTDDIKSIVPLLSLGIQLIKKEERKNILEYFLCLNNFLNER